MSMILPVDSFIDAIAESLSNQQNLILTAEPGAGKTTRVPPLLAQKMNWRVLVLEPRRIAAISAAKRIAEEHGWNIGTEVGYHVRFENMSSANTKLLFVTEALLNRRLLSDPELSGIDLVILDEFHERSLHTDLAIGLLKELQELSRPDLKILVMSATLETQSLSNYLGSAPVIKVPGKSFPLEVQKINESLLLRTDKSFFDRALKGIQSLRKQTDGDILVFLPGTFEIRKLHELLAENDVAKGDLIVELFGALQISDQQLALQKANRRKIILATNIAESALTIDGVSAVLDTGIARIMRFNERTGNPRLELSRISKASAKQRAGRAARQGPGICLELWNKLDEASMPAFEAAAIFREDLCETLLLLAYLKITDFAKFSWFQAPEAERLEFAIRQLRAWDALDEQNRITSIGQDLARLPLHPRWGRMILAGQDFGLFSEACEWAAILSEADSLGQQEPRSDSKSDLLDRWENYRSRGWPSNLKRAVQLFNRIEKNLASKTRSKSVGIEIALQEILLASFSDRICRRRRPNEAHAQMIDGKGVQLHKSSAVQSAEFFFALAIMESDAKLPSVAMASAISRELLESHFIKEIKVSTEISYSAEADRLVKFQTKKIGALLLSDPVPIPLTSAEIQEHLPTLAVAKWGEILANNSPLASWYGRYSWYSKRDTGLKLQESQIFSALEMACVGARNLQDLFEKDLVYPLELSLGSELVDKFRAACPDSVLAPSGVRHPIKYFEDKDPILEIRLQEVFGWTENPRINDGKTLISLHLLGPNYRAVQITNDLASFWKNTYPEVRGELRSRYPKHKWPDDPLSAVAEAKGRPRRV